MFACPSCSDPATAQEATASRSQAVQLDRYDNYYDVVLGYVDHKGDAAQATGVVFAPKLDEDGNGWRSSVGIT
ncbi:MAG: hypothetical protein HY744_23565 [Deltaproteobacteria bacterium]|nr:hypothetical protein [Deltaproteobacteria bacterium]